MALMEQYRPPGRSHRAGRAQADNDVFEGLPVKQWGQTITHVSLAPPKSDAAGAGGSGGDGSGGGVGGGGGGGVATGSAADKWADAPMPRDYQLLQPWTQQLLRLARSGKFGNSKRKADPDALDDDKHDDDHLGEDGKAGLEDRGYVARKWKPVPEALLEPEHKHFEFLAKRRKGLPSLYAPEVQNGPAVVMRRTKVQKTGPEGEVTIYEVLVPEGQTVEGEVTETTELADVKPVVAAPGTVIEGVGIANEEGVVVAEHLKPAAAPRRNRPPPKKKGGPGRGKKRVTFTNPDGSTYTTIVPNATKIVPEPGQIVTHVAKGEEAKADITAEQAAANAAARQQGHEGEEGEEGEGSDDEGDEGDDDDDREEGEVSEDAPSAGNTPVPPIQGSADVTSAPAKTEDVAMVDAPPSTVNGLLAPPVLPSKGRDVSSSPELPLAKTSHSRSGSLVTPPAMDEDTAAAIAENAEQVQSSIEATEAIEAEKVVAEDVALAPPTEAEKAETGDEDLLGGLEKSLEAEKEDPSA